MINQPDANTDLRYREFLAQVAQADVNRVLKKDADYGASWKKLGGVGAYINVRRKIDRLMNQVERDRGAARQYDIFGHIAKDQDEPEEGILDTIRDLRGYLLLIEADVLGRSVVTPLVKPLVPRALPPAKPRTDGQEHPFGYQPDEEA